MTWNTFSSRNASRPATATISIRASQPAIHSAALGLEGVRSIIGNVRGNGGRVEVQRRYRRPATICNVQIGWRQGCAGPAIGAKGTRHSGWSEAISAGMTAEIWEESCMRILQPAEWSKPRGFSHGVEFDAPGRWIVLAGQTGGDEKGDYAADMAAQVARVRCSASSSCLAEAGAGPQHIVRLTWYLTSRSRI